jgi:hypothetical protein
MKLQDFILDNLYFNEGSSMDWIIFIENIC